MKKLVLFVAVLFFLFSHLTSFTQEKSLLWEISGNGLKKPSYLFGTIHLICRPDYIWTDKMKKAFEATEKVCLEMDLDDMNLMMEISSGLMDKTGKKLSSYFSTTDYSKLKKYMKDTVGIDLAMFEMMKPVALQSMMVVRSTSCDDAASYEDSLMKVAKKDGKELLGLESAQEQLDALESIPVDSVLAGLMEVVDGKDDGAGEAEYQKLVAAYRDQDVALMHRIIVGSESLAGSSAKLVDDRNRKWIPVIRKMMNNNPTFFAVGAGHLGGSVGVIALLRAEGYKLKAVR